MSFLELDPVVATYAPTLDSYSLVMIEPLKFNFVKLTRCSEQVVIEEGA